VGWIFPLIYRRYLGILGASTKRKGTSERDGYDRLRESLSGGNLASRLYSDWLTRFLNAVDRAFSAIPAWRIEHCFRASFGSRHRRRCGPRPRSIAVCYSPSSIRSRLFSPSGPCPVTNIFDRTWLALVLTCQVFAGALIGIAAQAVLAIGVIFYVLPWMGFELLDTARAVAEFDLPMRLLGLRWGNP
jgi:hypothetical protein